MRKRETGYDLFGYESLDYLKPPIRLATVFSGMGCVEYSLKEMNIPHEIVFACDNDKFTKQNFFANFDIKQNSWYDDIKDIKGNKYKGKIDLLVGGSPCQSFSIVGKRKGFDDIRGTLFFDYIKLISDAQPEVFIFENVSGLLSHDKKNTFRIIKKHLRDTGYHIFSKVLNTLDFGIPQNRERIFIVGFRNPVEFFNFPKPIPLKVNLNQYLEDCQGESNPLLVPFKTNKFYLNRRYNPKTSKFLKISPKFSPTLLTRLGNLFFYYKKNNKGQLRYPNIDELLKIQGYINYINVVSYRQLYKQVGNSISVPVMKALLKQFITMDGNN